MEAVKILALNPFHGGSHKAFLEKWQEQSLHYWEVLSLPDSHWKWRLQFAAVHFANEVRSLYEKGERWDVIFCTDMMNAAEFRGLTPFLNDIPLVVYFHENQLTYPLGAHHKFDLSLAMTNLNSALAADEVWFNSAFHREDFLNSAEKLLKTKPGEPVDVIDKVRAKTQVQYQAVDNEFYLERMTAVAEPLNIVWAARWEEDKNPGLFFMAMRALRQKGRKFNLFVLGEEMDTEMACFQDARVEFEAEIKHFGFAESKEDYRSYLQKADIFVSTADHEFFGITAVEAAASGCIPIVPEHLAYPEVLSSFRKFFYKPRSSRQLVQRIEQCLEVDSFAPAAYIKDYLWSKRGLILDNAIIGAADKYLT